MQKWFKEIVGSTIGTAGFEALRSLITAFTKKTGEKVAEEGFEWYGYKIWGIKTEDERRFGKAIKLMSPPDWTRLSKRLSALESEANDYYRVINMEKDAKDIAETATMHARMSDQDWTRYCSIMNVGREKNNESWEKFMKWAETHRNLVIEAFRSIGRGIAQGNKEVNQAIDDSGIIPIMDDSLRSIWGGIMGDVDRIRNRRR